MSEHQDTSMAIDNVQRNYVPIIRDNSDQNHQSQRRSNEKETFKIPQYLRKIVKYLLSPLGLVCLVVVYAIAGGFLFQLLEQHQEKVNCQEAHSKHMMEITKLKQRIVAYIQYNATSSSSLTYSTKKDNKTVACVKIGSILYRYRDFVISTFSKYRYEGNDCSVITKWTYANSFLFAITIVTIVGYETIVPKTWEGQICCICYATIGIPIYLLCAAKISVFLAKVLRFIYSKVLYKPYYMIKKRRVLARKAKLGEENVMNMNRVNADDNSTKKTSNIEEDEQQRNEQVVVPLTITTLIIVVAVIVFDDFVPGQSDDDPNAGTKLILRVVFKLFGMSIVAMCYDLMHKEIRSKFRWFGRKINTIRNEEAFVTNKKDKKLDNNKCPPTADSNPVKNTNGKMVENENTTRKLKLHNDITRVHPVRILHQLAAATKIS